MPLISWYSILKTTFKTIYPLTCIAEHPVCMYWYIFSHNSESVENSLKDLNTLICRIISLKKYKLANTKKNLFKGWLKLDFKVKAHWLLSRAGSFCAEYS